MIRVAFTIDNIEISAKDSKKIKRFGVELQIINITVSRILLGSLIKNKGRMNSLERFLKAKGYNPIMIYALNKDGTEIEDLTFNETEYISTMPDIINFDEDGNEISRERPVIFKEIHTFSGWEAMTI